MVEASRGAVVITGAGTGIGEASALRLDRLGFRVFAAVHRADEGGALRGQASDRLTPVLLDVTEADSIAAAAGQVRSALGEAGLAGLVNNAGIAVGGPLEFLPIEDFRKNLEVNVVGNVAVTQAFLSLIRKGRGRIVNIGSVSGRIAAPFVAPYAASKHALEAISDSLRVELRPWKIQVSLVEPGPVATPIWKKSIADVDERMRHLPPEAHGLYDASFAGLRRGVEARASRAIPVEHVVEAIVHALTAKQPKTRYLVGREARIMAMVAMIPDRLRDQLVVRRLEK